MERRGFSTARSYAPNLAPMVDVVMVILVFFMLNPNLNVLEGALPTELPSRIGPGGGASIEVIPSVRIALLESLEGSGCRIIVMDVELPDGSFRALAGLLRQKRAAGVDAQSRVLIGAEPGVEYQHVISAMDACVRAGFSNIQFSVNPDGSNVSG